MRAQPAACKHIRGPGIFTGAFIMCGTILYSHHMATKDTYAAIADQHWDMPIKGKANPYTSMNGNMFSFLSKQGDICLRLSKDSQSAYWQAHGGEPVMQYGSVMRGYVALSDEVLADGDACAHWFSLCLADAQALPAKATKK